MSVPGFVFVVASFAALCFLPVAGAKENTNGVSLIKPLLTRERKNDDVSLPSLLTLVQQQAATIQQQEAVNLRQDSTIQQQAASIQQQQASLQAIQAQVAHLQTSVTALKTQVFFTARVNRSPVTMAANSPLRFETVLNNVGGGYNAATGVFRAPEAGTYVFYAQLMMNLSNSIDWYIQTAKAYLCHSRLEGTVPFDSSSCFATVALQKGEEVFVNGHGRDVVVDGGGRCSFSGFRLP